MNRRPIVLASLILFGAALLVLTLAASICPQPVGAQPAHAESQTIRQAPLSSASAVWSNVPITNAGLNGTSLKAVTVDSAGTVWAVGFYPNSLVIISSTNGGSSWYTFTQNLGTSSELWGVAAVSPTNIFAVGNYTPASSSKAKTLVMHYNGSGWSQASSVDFPNQDSRLLAVAATASGDVWATGRSLAPAGLPISTLVERWDSATSSFVAVNSSNLNLRQNNLLYGVALTAANNVWVVGEADARGLIGRWNGTSWAVTVYSPDTNIYKFYGVALDPSTNARVVGYRQINGVNQPLMTRYTFNGGAISLSSAFADTQLSGSNYLYGVAVTTTNDVWAVGNDTLTEHYDGLSWESVPAELVGSLQQWFYGVAIDPVRDGAWAVGYYSNGASLHPLVERYGQPVTPQPPLVTTSRYIIATTNAYTQGNNQCHARESGVVVLHFGAPAYNGVLSGTILHDDLTFFSTDQIAGAVERFADGFYDCASSDPTGHPPHVTIAVGTSTVRLK